MALAKKLINAFFCPNVCRDFFKKKFLYFWIIDDPTGLLMVLPWSNVNWTNVKFDSLLQF